MVCTGRGQHAQQRITGFVDQQEPEEESSVAWGQTSRWDVIADSRPEAGFTLRFKCKQCRRDVRLREPNALAVIGALRQASGSGEDRVLDISVLPC